MAISWHHLESVERKILAWARPWNASGLRISRRRHRLEVFVLQLNCAMLRTLHVFDTSRHWRSVLEQPRRMGEYNPINLAPTDERVLDNAIYLGILRRDPRMTGLPGKTYTDYFSDVR